MFVATHLTMGVMIGQNIPTPGLAFSVGVASHFMLDIVPHGDSKLYYAYKQGAEIKKSLFYVFADVIVSLALFTYFLEVAPYASRGTMIAGAIGGILPDFIVALGEIIPLKILQKFQNLHIRIHDAIASRVGNVSFYGGVVLQLVVLVFFAFLTR